jgi:hypothetical protein
LKTAHTALKTARTALKTAHTALKTANTALKTAHTALRQGFPVLYPSTNAPYSFIRLSPTVYITLAIDNVVKQRSKNVNDLACVIVKTQHQPYLIEHQLGGLQVRRFLSLASR